MSGIFLLKPRRLSLTIDHSIGHGRCHQVFSIVLGRSVDLDLDGGLIGHVGRIGSWKIRRNTLICNGAFSSRFEKILRKVSDLVLTLNQRVPTFAARAATVMAGRGSSASRGIHRSRGRTRVATKKQSGIRPVMLAT